jgi:hypothetical protein
MAPAIVEPEVSFSWAFGLHLFFQIATLKLQWEDWYFASYVELWVTW